MKKQKDAYYFSHDYSTTNDPKIQALLGKYGAKGYGVYWRVVEILHEEQEHKLYLKPYIFEAIASTFKDEVNVVKEIIEYQIKICELFKKRGKYIYSERVLENIKKRDKIKEVRSLAGQRSAQIRKEKSANVKQIEINAEENSRKEKKEKEKKEKKIIEFRKENIDWKKLLSFFNETFTKNNRVFNDSNKNKYLARLKEGYTRDNIRRAMLNVKKDPFHSESNFKYCTLEYFGRSATLDKFGFDYNKNPIYIPTK